MNRLTAFFLVLIAAAALAACGGSPETPQAPAPPQQVAAPAPAPPPQNFAPEAEPETPPAPVEYAEEPEPTPPPAPRRVERPRAEPQAPPPPAPPARRPDPEPVAEYEPPRTQPTPPPVEPPPTQTGQVIPPSPPRPPAEARPGDVWVGDNGEPVNYPPPAPNADRAPAPPDVRRDVPVRDVPIRSAPVVLREGTPIEVRMAEEVSTNLNQTGDRFEAILERDLEVDGRVVARRGDRVTGSLRDVDPGGRVKGVASMTLVLERIEGRENSIPIQTNEIGVEAQSTKKKDAATVGAAAGIGALIGAIAGGKKGAAIGAAIGGGAGTARVITSRGKEAVVEREQLLSFRLERDVTVSP